MIDLKMAGKILKATKPNIGPFIGSIVLIVLASLFEVFGISLIIPIVNGFAAGGDFLSNLKIPHLTVILKIMPFRSNIGIFAFLMLLMSALVGASNLALFGSVSCMSRFSSNFVHVVRTKIFARYLSFGKAFYDRTPLGLFTHIMLNNTAELSGTLVGLRGILKNLIMAAAFLVFLFVISWQLALFALPIVLVLYYSLNWLIKKIRLSAEYKVAAAKDLSTYSVDILSNMALVRSHSSKENEYKTFAAKSDIVRFHIFNVTKKDGTVPLVTDAIASVGFLALAFFSAVFYMQAGILPVGRFLVFFFALRRFVIYVKPMNDLKVIMARMAPLIQNIGSIFDDADKALMKDGTANIDTLHENLAFKNVNFRYITEKQVLKNLSFTIKKGQTTAIIGPTGAGKTTIVHLLCRFYDCDSGAIEIDGVNIKDITFKSLRKNIALISQDTALFNDTIRNNIVYGMEKQVSQHDLDEAARKAHIHDFIMTLPQKYDTVIGDRGVRLSGGEKQRVSIARAILKNADILILDEATSSLDSETERLIQKALDDLTRTKTVMAIAHRLSTIKNADQVMVLENGEVTEQGKLDELLEKQGRFFYYWQLQKFLTRDASKTYLKD